LHNEKNSSIKCDYIDSLKNQISREHWYPPNCNDLPQIDYCTEIEAIIITFGSACGKRFLASYIPSEKHGRLSMRPGESDKLFYTLMADGKIPGLSATFLDSIGKVSAVYTEPPGRSSLNFKIDTYNGGDYFYVKAYRILEENNMEPLILAYLRDSKADFSPRMVGFAEFSGYFTHIFTDWYEGEPIVSYFVKEALRTLETGSISIPKQSSQVGDLLGEFHCLMSSCPYDWCRPQPITEDDIARWAFRINWRAEHMGMHPDPLVKEVAMRLFDHSNILGNLSRSNLHFDKTRTHGDPHLYQFISTKDGRLLLVDYEGEPERLPANQNEKEPPIRDLAVIYRSLHYIAVVSYSIQKGLNVKEAAMSIPNIMYLWIDSVFENVLEKYKARIKGCYNNYYSDQALLFWSIERATYEFFYESTYNTGLESIPLLWLEKSLDLLDKAGY
jgi:hypothetical protein